MKVLSRGSGRLWAAAALLGVVGLAAGCGGDDPAPMQPGLVVPEVDTDGGGPIQPAPAPDLNYGPDVPVVPDPYGGPDCYADITTC